MDAAEVELPPITERGLAGQIMDVAWPSYSGNHQTAEFWDAFAAAVTFTLDVIRENGLVIAPKEPTEEMITAGFVPTAAWQNIQGSALTVNREKMRLRYRAMVAAVCPQ